MLIFVQSFFLILLETQCCKIFLEIFGKKRAEKGGIRNAAVLAGWVVSVYVTAMAMEQAYFMCKQGAVILLTAGFMTLYLKAGFLKELILSSLFQGLLSAVDYCVLLFYLSVSPNMPQTGESYDMRSLLFVLIGKILLFILVLTIRRYLGNDYDADLTQAQWLRFLFFPVFTIGMIAAMITTSAGAVYKEKEGVLTVIAFCLAGMNLVVFSLINDILKREQELRKTRIFRLQVENQTGMYRSISENFEKQRKKTHEFKNQVLCMEALAAQKKYGELERYIQNLCSSLSSELPVIQTNHVIVDAILNSKYQEMKKKKIVWIYELNDLSGIRIQDEDLVVLLSNLLNNAIEACGQCREKRMVKLKFLKEERSLILSVRNTCAYKAVYQDGEFQTTKEHEKEEHGVGLKNIADTIMKYGGYYTIQNREEEFYFSAVIPR